MLGSPALAQGADAGSDAGLEAGASDAGEQPPDTEATQRQQLARLRDVAAAVRALIVGQLEAAREPQSLFDVPLEQPTAVELEARRLARMLGETAEDA